MNKYKDKIKLSNMLLEALCKLKAARLKIIQDKLKEFGNRCTEATKNSHIFYTAVEKRWLGAAEKVRSRVSRDIDDFSNHLEQFKNTINADDMKLPKPGDVIAELLQIEEEFGELKFDLKAQTLSIITESIVLEEMSFGAFEIRLYLNKIKKLTTESPYKIIALEPNPADSDCDVTHPHVSGEKLCEGDGFIPIRKAIQQGRLNDFFTIIVQILQTYNPGSPYVSLEDWEGGISCYDCGYTVAGDESYYCEECENDYCSHCSTYCRICDTTVCMGCSYECQACGQPVCRHCTTECTDCEETLCNDCIDEEGLCDNCQEQRKEQEDEELEEEPTKPEAKPAVQSDSLGKTRIPA